MRMGLGFGPLLGNIQRFFGLALSGIATCLLAGCGAACPLGDSACTNANGASWSGPAAFSFTNQSGVNLNATITSNAVTLTGFTELLPVGCTKCSGILVNGSPYLTNVVSGDTVQIQVVSSSSANTAVTASLTVGSTTSGSWTVTTGSHTPGNTPSAFSFVDKTGENLGATITSNTVSLGGTFTNVTATCGTGCTAISHNGGAFVAGPVTGFNTGDRIAIRQTASSSNTTTVTAIVTVGDTTSSAWSVTTVASGDPCGGTPAIGTVCADGSVYAGLTPDGNVAMYVARCDAGQSWNGTSCTGTQSFDIWSDGNTLATNVTSATTGSANTATLDSDNTDPTYSSVAPFPAATYCAALSLGGHTDWYLPASNELNELYAAKFTYGNAVFGFDTTGNSYWSSTEASSQCAYSEQFSTGNVNGLAAKNIPGIIRCVRKN